ncbi:MAG: DUF3153 domain-containing protein [Microcoleaceae cyanobacterium]|jgi:hypothetical protein
MPNFLKKIAIVISAILVLTGCVQSDVKINFDSQTHGEIVQIIKLGEQVTSFSNSTIQGYFNTIDRRARRLQGRTKKVSNEEIKVIIPFNNGKELSQKFNAFFNPIAGNKTKGDIQLENDLPQWKSHLKVKQNNFVFFLRNRVNLEVDLRELSVRSPNDNVLISPGNLLDLHLSLNTPWGAKNISPDAKNALPLEILPEGKALIWQLKPGEINHLEAVFWLPSPVGIGALVIILFVTFGWYVKYQLFPRFGIGKKRQKNVQTQA